VWQALGFGFLGTSAEEDTRALRTCLPEAWHAVGPEFRFMGRHIDIRAEHDR
jgi:hypothetical protein